MLGIDWNAVTTQEIDFEGQRLAQKIWKWTIYIVGAIGWLVGFVLQDFRVTVGSVILATLVSCALCLPAWPYLKRHPLNWLPASPPAAPADNEERQRRSPRRR